MNRVIKGLTKFVCLIFLGIGLFSILKNWNETGILNWSGFVCLFFSAGFYGLSYAVSQNLLLENVRDEQHEEIEENEQ